MRTTLRELFVVRKVCAVTVTNIIRHWRVPRRERQWSVLPRKTVSWLQRNSNGTRTHGYSVLWAVSWIYGLEPCDQHVPRITAQNPPPLRLEAAARSG